MSQETARENWEEGEDDAKSAWPLMTWAAHVVQWSVQWVAKPQGGANPIKRVLSSDRRLQLASLKLELLVIADQHAAVNTFPGLVHTARHTMGVGFTRSR